MKKWDVRVRTIIDYWVSVEADNAEEAEREALIKADSDDLCNLTSINEYVTDIYVTDVYGGAE